MEKSVTDHILKKSLPHRQSQILCATTFFHKLSCNAVTKPIILLMLRQGKNLGENPMLTVKQAAERLGIHVNTVLLWIARGDLPAVKFGTQWAVKLADVDRAGKKRRSRGRPKKASTDDEQSSEGDLSDFISRMHAMH